MPPSRAPGRAGRAAGGRVLGPLRVRERVPCVDQRGDPARAARDVAGVLEGHGRPQDAARSQFVVKNTVIYRVKRAEELLGHAIRTRQLGPGTALRLAAVIGPDADSPAPTT
ncbi:MAG: helix-turn-helix domain-containing protein [Streptomyces sp.]|nr:helix-turn-helix domain-containing protein [Streptomyces sp.]